VATVVISADALPQIDRLPKAIRARVLVIVHRLARWPDVSGAKPLRGDLAGSYRVRTGDDRIQFHPSGERVVIDKVGHRDGFYDER
jgi:mRNA-degrading endonuclease RelE of RelBE toxin-antitoxin system